MACREMRIIHCPVPKGRGSSHGYKGTVKLVIKDLLWWTEDGQAEKNLTGEVGWKGTVGCR